MTWQWWIVVGLIALIWVPWLIGIFGRRTPQDASGHPEDSLVAMHDRALIAYRAGAFPKAETILRDAIERSPGITEGSDTDVDLRFRLVLMLASLAREWHEDPQQELQWLEECAVIVATRHVEISPPSQPDHLNLIYMMQMNRAVAAGKLKRFPVEEEALTLAFDAAHEPATKCKCLAYQAWCILRQKDHSKNGAVESIIERFDALADRTTPAPLKAQIRIAEAWIRLYRNDLAGARDACARAMEGYPAERSSRALVELLLTPDVSATEAIQQIEQLMEGAVPEKPAPPPLAPLPAGIIEPAAWEAIDREAGVDAISEEEHAKFEAQASALAKSGQYARQEALSRQMLERHTRPDLTRADLLHILARALRSQDKTDEALARASEAIAVAHRCGDVRMLVMMLDLRAEILCFEHEYVPALRALDAAEKYLRDAGIHNAHIECWIAHTRGMAYSGCGWWEVAAANLEKAMEWGEHLRNWSEWAGAAGDFVGLTLRRNEAEGPDAGELEEALALLERIAGHFDRFGDRYLGLQARVNMLRIRSRLSVLRRDIPAMWEVRDQFVALNDQVGGRDGFFSEPGNFGRLVQWTVDDCRHRRAMIAIRGTDRADVKNTLDVQLSLLERATSRAPRTAALWIEKAALHLFRARYGLDDKTAALLAAADCVETVMDVLRSVAKRYTAAEVRAGWLGTSSELFEMLAEVACFALEGVTPASMDITARMVALAQYLRARSRHDLTRSAGRGWHTDDGEIAGLLTRIRLLQRWLERLNHAGRRGKDPSRTAVRAEEASSLLDTAAVEINQQYPEYALLLTVDQVTGELQKCKRELDERVTGKSVLRADSSLVEEEAPFDFSEFQAGLQDGEVVLDYYVGPLSLHVAILSREGVRVLRLPVSDMREFREVTRKGLYPPVGGESISAASMRQCSRWLFSDSLVSSLEDLRARRLYIVASGPLWRVPFPWLDAAGRLVLERWETCIVPTARFAGSDWTATSFRRACAIGHPGQEGHVDFLPMVELEVNGVAQLLQGSAVFGAKATPTEIVHRILPEAEILHFACHGVCDPVSPLTSSLLFEPDEEHRDGRLMLYEILQAPLRATLVSLGACQTAQVEGPATFPESLAHAFLGGGVQFVIASLWNASDDECEKFAQWFYGALKQGAAPAAAFREAQLAQLESIRGYRDGYAFSDADLTRAANFVLLSARQPERNIA